MAIRSTFKMLIGGVLETAPETFKIVNPATAQAFAEAPNCSREQLNKAVQAAAAAFPAWAATPPEKRKELMLEGAAIIQENIEGLAQVLTREQGKPIKSATGEIMGIVGYMTYFANANYEFSKVIVDNKKETVVQKRTPLGVVGGITPWNFPPLMGAWKMAEALMTGNTMVLKPSPYTPLSTLMLGELLQDAFPPGVFNVVSGGDEVGKWMTEHKDIAKISFTGSTRTGKAIQASTASTLKRLTLELGGNDAGIVLADADVKSIAPKLFQAAMGNSGQICVALKRLYVHESKHDELVGELATLANASKVGDGFEKGTQFGPINNKMQFDRVKELVEDAKRAGAIVHAGGQPLDREGYFFPPTILGGVAEGTRIVDEEQFGPVLPVIPFSDPADAVARANATEYGLGASIWGNDVDTASEIAQTLMAGSVWVNSHGTLSPDVPFGGMKESGVGRQMGECTLEGYTDVKVIRVPKMIPKSAL